MAYCVQVNRFEMSNYFLRNIDFFASHLAGIGQRTGSHRRVHVLINVTIVESRLLAVLLARFGRMCRRRFY